MLSQTLPFAIGIASSPIPLIPLLLLLLTPRARATSAAFLSGWLLGIFGGSVLFVILAAFVDARESPRAWVPWTLIAIGCLLIFGGIRQWAARRKPKPLPGWLQAMQTAGPQQAFRIGLLIAVANPKIMLFAFGAAVAISAAALSLGGNAMAIGIFTAVAALPVALPVVLFFIMGDSMLEPIRRANDWLRTNYVAVSAVILFAIGILLVFKGWRGV